MKLIGIVVGALVLVGLLIVGSALAIGDFLAPQSHLQKADAIVAISGGETDARAAEAVRLYKDGYAPTIIFSGAALDTSGPSNAKVMERQALADGVPAGAILIDEVSTNTAENAAAVAAIVQARNIHSLILVTSPYHQRRANISFTRALGTSFTIINHSAFDQNWSRSRWWLRSDNYGITLDELQKTVFLMLVSR